jgi:hypothetical protein
MTCKHTLFGAAITIILLSSALSQTFGQNGLPRPDPIKSRYDTQCALVSAAIVTGVYDDQFETQLSDCNNHPDRQACLASLAFIVQNNGKVPPKLNCHDPNWRRHVEEMKARYPDLKPREAEEDSKACALLAAAAVTGIFDADDAKNFAKCNNSRDRDECRATRNFIKKNGNKFPAELTCE